MANPPATTLNAPSEAPNRNSWLDRTLGPALGVAWWGALLIPEATQPFLLEGSPPAMAWAFVRVVGIVTVACAFFRYAYRRRPKLSPLTALACLWGGSIAFLLSDVAHAGNCAGDGMALLAAPLLFIIFSKFVALPMTALTAVALARAERRAKTPPDPW